MFPALVTRVEAGQTGSARHQRVWHRQPETRPACARRRPRRPGISRSRSPAQSAPPAATIYLAAKQIRIARAGARPEELTQVKAHPPEDSPLPDFSVVILRVAHSSGAQFG